MKYCQHKSTVLFLQCVSSNRGLQAAHTLSSTPCIPHSSVRRKREHSQPIWKPINPRKAGHASLWPEKIPFKAGYLIIHTETQPCMSLNVCRMLVDTGRSMWEWLAVVCTDTDFHYTKQKRILLSVIQFWMVWNSSCCCLIKRRSYSTGWQVILIHNILTVKKETNSSPGYKISV